MVCQDDTGSTVVLKKNWEINYSLAFQNFDSTQSKDKRLTLTFLINNQNTMKNTSFPHRQSTQLLASVNSSRNKRLLLRPEEKRMRCVLLTSMQKQGNKNTYKG